MYILQYTAERLDCQHCCSTIELTWKHAVCPLISACRVCPGAHAWAGVRPLPYSAMQMTAYIVIAVHHVRQFFEFNKSLVRKSISGYSRQSSVHLSSSQSFLQHSSLPLFDVCHLSQVPFAFCFTFVLFNVFASFKLCYLLSVLAGIDNYLLVVHILFP